MEQWYLGRLRGADAICENILFTLGVALLQPVAGVAVRSNQHRCVRAIYSFSALSGYVYANLPERIYKKEEIQG